MRKKVLIVLLTGIMAVSLAGCAGIPGKLASLLAGEKKQTLLNADAKKHASDETAQPPEDEPAALPGEEAVPGDTAGASGDAVLPGGIRYSISSDWDYDYDEDIGVSFAYMNYDILHIEPDSAPALADTVNGMFADTAEVQRDMFAGMMEDARAQYEEGYLYSPYCDNTALQVTRADSAVFSFKSLNDSYWGGAHGYYSVTGYVFDTGTGQPLTWRDFFTCSEDAMTELLVGRIESDYRDDLDGFFDYRMVIGYEVANYTEVYSDGSGYTYDLNFYADNSGVTFIFNPYEIACYAAGMQMITFSYDEYADIMDPKYATRAEAYSIPFYAGKESPFAHDIDGDGRQDIVTVELNMNEYDWAESVTVSVNGREQTFEMYGYSVSPMFVHKKEGNFLVLKYSAENDWEYGDVYAVGEGGELKEVSTFGGTMDDCVNPECFPFESRADVLSTYGVVIQARIGGDGTIEYLEDYFRITRPVTITSKVSLTLPVADGDTLAWTADEVTIPAGAEYLLSYTDGETCVCAYVEGFGYVWLKLEKNPDTWWRTINGIPEDDCFEVLYYAG